MDTYKQRKEVFIVAKFAFKDIGTPPPIDAASLHLNQKGTYYCTTEGCTATMHTRDLTKACACFVSYDKNTHIDPRVCLKKDNFKPDKYDETLFNYDDLFRRMLNPVERDNPIGHGAGKAGHNTRLPIRRLKGLYEMCLQFRPKGTYNGYNIEDILVDKNNYTRYRMGIEGNRIVCCTFFKYDLNKQTITMNYPYVGKSHIRIHVADELMFKKCLNKLIDKTHNNTVVIGGHWTKSTDIDILAECELVSIGKQICNT